MEEHEQNKENKKTCCKCGQEKNLNEFPKRKYVYKCKSCTNELVREKSLERKSLNDGKNIKICSKCGAEKQMTEFNRGRTECRVCTKAYKAASREKIKIQNKEYREKNKEACAKRNREYQLKYPERSREATRKHRAKNREKLNKDQRERRLKNREKENERNREYRLLHKEEINAKARERIAKNREKINERARIAAKKNRYKNIEIKRAKRKAYVEKNRDRINEVTRNRRNLRWETDLDYKARTAIRNFFSLAIKKEYKTEKALSLLGCTIEYFRHYISTQFIQGMTWENWGRGSDCWHIDHIIPTGSLDLTLIENQRKAFHYSNLRPLWENDNLEKGERTDWITPEIYSFAPGKCSHTFDFNI